MSSYFIQLPVGYFVVKKLLAYRKRLVKSNLLIKSKQSSLF